MPLKGNPSRYSKYGKLLTPLTDEQFAEKINTGHFVRRLHKAFAVGLWYFALRKMELLRAKKEQFTITRTHIIFNVGKRLKHSLETAPLKLPLEAPFSYELQKAIEETRKGKKVFPFSPKTAYNICDRLGFYTHYLRLCRITNLYDSIDPRTNRPFTTAKLRSFTGLSVVALNFYVGLVDIESVSESLGRKGKQR